MNEIDDSQILVPFVVVAGGHGHKRSGVICFYGSKYIKFILNNSKLHLDIAESFAAQGSNMRPSVVLGVLLATVHLIVYRDSHWVLDFFFENGFPKIFWKSKIVCGIFIFFNLQL